MARLPNPGGDNGTWGVILNDFLAVSHDTAGALLANSVNTTQIADSAVSVAKIATSNTPGTNQSLVYNGTAMQWANMEPFIATNGTSDKYLGGDKVWYNLTKYSVGLGNVNDTSDLNKPISTATQTALDAKAPQFRPVTTGTAAATAAKTATVAGYTPAAGDLIRLILTLGNSVNAPTLSINGGAAYPLRIANANVTTVAATTAANGFFFLYFDGSAYHMFGSNRNSDTDTTYAVLTTAEVVTGTATTARSINAVLGAYLRDQGALKAWTDRFVDEDTMVSNSDVKWPTQQSVKAYVDTSLSTSAATKANTVHSHAAADINSGTFDAARLPAATQVAAGSVVLATDEEAVSGTDTTKAVTPAGLSAVVNSVANPIVFVDSVEDIPPGTPVDTLVVVRAV